MNLKLHVWRQRNASEPGRMVKYDANGVNPHMSFLEMLDVVNEDLIGRGEEPIAFDSDCREGICGTCSAVINGVPHGGHNLPQEAPEAFAAAVIEVAELAADAAAAA